VARDDIFDGAWLVVEYVHDPDGTFVGVVRQRRVVEVVDEGRLRVTQTCDPAPELAGHPMAAFAGEWTFDLEVAGRHRHYLGPDVVGLGTQWQPGAMTGSGVWPRFGHEFTSYGVLVQPDRQLTGGFFSVAGRPVADIVGVAVPESAGVEPTLDLDAPLVRLDDSWMLTRTVGPLSVAVDRPSPPIERRLLTMHDPVGGVLLAIEQQTTFGDERTVVSSIQVTRTAS
jgi:hypothetical protein|tara:strand:- start:97 stop:777 length:681 start_codon:yes stop_codon:yes gene_type:complete